MTTANEIKNLTESIFFRINFKGEFKILTNEIGETFHNLHDAINFIRENEFFSKQQTELSNFDHAISDESIWDNL